MNGKTKVAEKTVTKADGWKWSFTDLDAKKDGVAINYTIEEVPLNGYTTAVNGYNVTNTLKTVHIAGEKTWDDVLYTGLRPDKITIRLKANGTEIAHKDDVKAPHWDWDFGNLPEYDKNGRKITYTITEDKVDGYKTTVKAFDVTNTLETVHIYGAKTWKNDKESNRPKSITIHLYADGKELTYEDVTKDDGWKWDFGERPKYTVKDGKITEIKYTIKEDKVTGYTTKIDGYNVTNTKNKTPYSSSDKLMQTGQLNWPIPVLGIGGAALLAVGVYLVIQKKKGHYEG